MFKKKLWKIATYDYVNIPLTVFFCYWWHQWWILNTKPAGYWCEPDIHELMYRRYSTGFTNLDLHWHAIPHVQPKTFIVWISNIHVNYTIIAFSKISIARAVVWCLLSVFRFDRMLQSNASTFSFGYRISCRIIDHDTNSMKICTPNSIEITTHDLAP